MPFRRTNEPDRVRRYSTDRQLARIDAKTARRVHELASASPEAIGARIEALRAEWSIERFLQLNAAAVGLTTALLAVTRDRRWGYATCAALAFFLHHAIDGFDPPLPLLRQLGVRSRSEIDREIYALELLRGDFDAIRRTDGQTDDAQVEAAIRAVGL